MNKAYVFGPFAALAVFGAVYFNFYRDNSAREAAKVAQVQADKQAKIQSDLDARKQAIAEAVKVQELRKQEREARDAKERADQQTRQLALDARDRAFRDQDRLARQLDRLNKELAEGQTVLAKLDADAQTATAEKDFLRAYVEKAQANAKSLTELLEKIAAAETARAAQTAAAAKSS